jgi:hypothetical protein
LLHGFGLDLIQILSLNLDQFFRRRSHVAEHSVIMKREHLSPGLKYEGAPTWSRNQ